jgi:hypothetical protein
MAGEGLNRVIAGAPTIVLWLGQAGVRASSLWSGPCEPTTLRLLAFVASLDGRLHSETPWHAISPAAQENADLDRIHQHAHEGRSV